MSHKFDATMKEYFTGVLRDGWSEKLTTQSLLHVEQDLQTLLYEECFSKTEL